MTIDMTNNRVPYGLLSDEEKAALHEHKKAGGEFLLCTDWCELIPMCDPDWVNRCVYRTVPLPKTQDVIAWEKLPDMIEWVARDVHGAVFGYAKEPNLCGAEWATDGWFGRRRIGDFPGIVQIGTCDWKDSKQRRPR
jgi:hypothetical protein